MIAKEKVVAFLAEYNQQLNTINDKINETTHRLEDLQLELRFLEEKELPEAIGRRVMAGDRSQENKIRKAFDKLQQERLEKAEDLIVLQNMLERYKQQAADEIKQLQRLLTEERNMIGTEAYERIAAAKKAYSETIHKETDVLYVYREIERQIQDIEVNAGRRNYTDTIFPIDHLRLTSLSIKPDEVIKIAKRL